MKRIPVFLLTAALVFGFFGCGNDIEDAADDITETSKVNYEEDAYADSRAKGKAIQFYAFGSINYDILGWSNYEDVFGMDNVYKENNMVGHSGSVVYFYDDADGNEQVLLTIENCATKEIDIDEDGITEIIAHKAGKTKAVVIYDYDINTETIESLAKCTL